MKQLFILTLSVLSALAATAKERTIDVSGNNTSSDYKTYSQSIRLVAADTVNVMLARYCYFSSAINGKGVLNIYAGGERCYLGTEKGKEWPNWTNYTGDVHIYPYPENSSSAGFYGVVLAHGGKSSSPENALDDAKSGKVNPSMANNRVTLHAGATICCEANTAGAGFRIGELQTEVGSTLQGYMKTKRAAYYLVGGLNTDATLAGKLMPSGYNDETGLSIIKEGTGTYTITGNDNYLSSGLRVLEGRVLVMNDRSEAEAKKLRGALGAKPNSADAIAYVFGQGVLGGTGSIGGTVDNYGTVEPGTDVPGLLTLKNYTAAKDANLVVHPASVLRFKVTSADSYDQLAVDGQLKYSTMTQDFTTSDEHPVLQLVVADDAALQVGTELTLMTVKSRSDGDWAFDVKANRHTWDVSVSEADGRLVYTLRLTSLADQQGGGGDDQPGQTDTTMGAFYDDGIDDAADSNTLRYYAEQCGKHIGVALCTYKGYQSDRDESGRQFNMMVAENEMKMDALQPSQGQFSYGSADQLVSFAQRNNMAVRGHCLVWHMQQPTWLSSDGKKNDKGWTRQQALDLMKRHITAVVTHFRGKVAEWDVVNECLDDDQSVVRTNPDGYKLRPTVWQLAIGDDYIDSAFVYARQADPDAVLYLNDYDVEQQGKAKTTAFYNLAMHLKRQGVPLDGVGLQCHFSVGDVDSLKLDQNIRRFGDAGLKCAITELDMGVASTSADNLEEQARNYRVVTDVVLNNDNCQNMVVWGIKDNDSWRQASSPLLYTAGLDRKPAWYAVRSALRHRVLTDTGIHDVHQDAPAAADHYYDLHGRRVSVGQLRHGIYIHGGRKVLVK